MPTEQHHSWFEQLTGFNPGEAIKKVEEAGSAALKKAEDVVPGFKQAEDFVSSGVKTVEKAVAGGVQKVKDAVGKPAGGEKPAVGVPKPPEGAGSGGKLSLSGSVGRGGKNKPADVLAVQQALNRRANAGLVADGASGPKTIAAIEAFQKSVGQAKPDGRVDPGGATARALEGGSAAGTGTGTGTGTGRGTGTGTGTPTEQIIKLLLELLSIEKDIIARVNQLKLILGRNLLGPCRNEALKAAGLAVAAAGASAAVVALFVGDVTPAVVATVTAQIVLVFAAIAALIAFAVALDSVLTCLKSQLKIKAKTDDEEEVKRKEKEIQDFENAINGLRDDITKLENIAGQIKKLAT
jgi:peptidoglycan hydrolase-like protein with peptidoglycan-binding domain